MYPPLQSMRGEEIKVKTVHELINEQNGVDEKNNRVALIKRIYFEIQPAKEDKGLRKSSP
jgi:hypothetical protein